ncbi:aminoglycoside phosphotransferase family protein [Streptomyces coelicoflavus]|uniref:phosphotransferase n=1 Tax=Streptomyces TaxID=1883 RepID=UPI001292791F|nr:MULTISPECIES: phosphotransferase [Streptomyces]MCX5041256.1 aminoglycoside phosphotransferase family protein [Streptomyces coelicoflavus]QFX79708.1 phosphotransferase [Streptomyces sp. SYP-A7193]
MLSDAPVAVDRGRYQDTVTPWEEPAWRAEALDWVRAGLTAHGIRPTGRWRVRLRPWSVVLRLCVAGQDPVWFKANPPASAFEGALTAALARWVPGHVLRPLAVHTDRGWSLLPDGGPLFRDVLARETVAPGAWEELVRQYAAVQHALTPRASAIARLGVPAVPTGALPGVLDRFDATTLPPRDLNALRELRPRLLEWCAELADLGVPDSLDHTDLHDGQLFRPAPGRFTFFDWGDAVVAHPFGGLAVPARRAVEHHGPWVLPRLRDAYLEPWTGAGRSTAQLRRAVSLAWRLGALNRAAAYGRLFPTASGAAGAATAAAGARCLLELRDEPPV